MPRTHHSNVPRKLPDGPIKLYPVAVSGEACIVNGRQCYEVTIDQMEWSTLLDTVLRQENARRKDTP